MNMYILIAIANSLVSTTYGHGEMSCGDYGKPRPCEYGAITASGEGFDPNKATAAIAAPRNYVLKPMFIGLKTSKSACQKIWINDKLNSRYIGERGFDLTPESVRLLTGKADPTWSGRLYVCDYSTKKIKKKKSK